MADCRTCKHNSYLSDPGIKGWVSCSHPLTVQKQPRWEKGDPAWINALTGDMPLSRIDEIGDCPTHEPQS